MPGTAGGTAGPLAATHVTPGRAASSHGRSALPALVETEMLTWMFRAWIGRFERDFGYDASYLREVLDAAGPLVLLRFVLATQLGSFRGGLPRDAWFAAGLAAIAAEDCGPCTQLCATMAARAGVPDALVAAVVRGDDAALSDEVRIATRFARAAVDRTDALDGLREQVVARFGRRGLVALAYAATAAGLYPSLKYALGHGQACILVRVGGELVPRAIPA